MSDAHGDMFGKFIEYDEAEKEVRSNDLLFCPFCGHPAVGCQARPEWPEENIEGAYYIRCTQCGARTDYASNEKSAVMEWNRRVK